ncbi:hypothetical protein PanWU01x14_324970, partial [Parasponia andersonii]
MPTLKDVPFTNTFSCLRVHLDNKDVAGNTIVDSIPLNNETTMVVKEIMPGPLNDKIVKERNLLQNGVDSEHRDLEKLNLPNDVVLEVKDYSEVHRISFIYGASSATIRRELWNSLDLVAPIWYVIGDFNTILGVYETIGNAQSSSCFDFASFSAKAGLVDLDTRGTFYTHVGRAVRGLVLSQLDRVLYLNDFLDVCT